MRLPSVSVIIPLYNHQKFITAALYSVVEQTYPAKEIIVIDDGSTDNSAELVSAVSEVRTEVTFWSHPNRGAHNTINAGIHRATGELIAILNSDDVYETTRLERTAHAFAERPDIDAVATNLTFIDAQGVSIPNPWFEGALAFYQECGDLGLALTNGNFIMTTSNLVARRALFGEIGYFADLRYAHDLDFFLRMVANGKKLNFLSESLVQYRIHGNNTISESQTKVKIEWAASIAMYLYLIWSRLPAGSGWNNVEAYLNVLRKHGLTELVLMFLAYFQANGIQTLERNTWQRDASFMSALQAVRQ